ncbi:hypothetical protein SAMN05660657_00921 [Geodermatophilus amargosae]|uniref:Uncharacterized protein n=1 Tax=Geodermatophilus amargosae TaxID=1296565 RepID=A0A1I6Y5H3_9ACTN|nr:hypothetical protein [Geodermatophilus amargosae]SFT45720.1 hypothetical protein SAMN05660657_00921 [Geodermatophilus amargosae]
MTTPAVHAPCVSLDGSAAGAGRDAENPLGIGGERLHGWIVAEGPEAAPERAVAAAGGAGHARGAAPARGCRPELTGPSGASSGRMGT